MGLESIKNYLKTEMPKWPDLYHLFWIFVLISFVGLMAETILSLPIDGYWKRREGLVWGPFSPIYGTGAVLFTLLLYRLRDKNCILIFIIAAVVGAAFEWFVGSSMERLFGFVPWSYIDQPLCIDGYTSVGMALIWGTAGLLWMRLGLPVVWKFIDAIPQPVARFATIFFVIFMTLDVAMTLMAFQAWFDRGSGVPVETPVQQFFAEHFSDEFMDTRFETISMYPVLAHR
ncbi:MAG: putative ABC transporter permease [Coriobacteriales bacterium]|nr:putative ABC transporter permease [Coriobacteriales bacterium]